MYLLSLYLCTEYNRYLIFVHSFLTNGVALFTSVSHYKRTQLLLFIYLFDVPSLISECQVISFLDIKAVELTSLPEYRSVNVMCKTIDFRENHDELLHRLKCGQQSSLHPSFVHSQPALCFIYKVNFGL